MTGEMPFHALDMEKDLRIRLSLAELLCWN